MLIVQFPHLHETPVLRCHNRKYLLRSRVKPQKVHIDVHCHPPVSCGDRIRHLKNAGRKNRRNDGFDILCRDRALCSHIRAELVNFGLHMQHVLTGVLKKKVQHTVPDPAAAVGEALCSPEADGVRIDLVNADCSAVLLLRREALVKPSPGIDTGLTEDKKSCLRAAGKIIGQFIRSGTHGTVLQNAGILKKNDAPLCKEGKCVGDFDHLPCIKVFAPENRIIHGAPAPGRGVL